MAKLKKAKKLTTGKKVAIGVGVAAVIGAILCYFYCPCFKKKEEGEGDDIIPPPDIIYPDEFIPPTEAPTPPPIGTNPGTGGSPTPPTFGMPKQFRITQQPSFGASGSSAPTLSTPMGKKIQPEQIII